MNSNFVVASLITAVTVTVGAASAEPKAEVGAATSTTEAQCAASFPSRLAEAQQAISAQEVYMRAYNRVMPWYKANCGLLPEIDRIVHNVKDKYAFTCDSRVRGRPAELTIKFLTEHQSPLPVSAFQAHAAENAQCASHDLVSLDLNEEPEPPSDATPRQRQVWQVQSTLRRLTVTCHGAQGVKAARCAASRAQSEKQLRALSTEAVATTAGESPSPAKAPESAR